MLKKLGLIYALLAVVTAIYQTYWGDGSHLSFMFNLGRSLVWPDIWFDSEIGPTIGGLVFAAIAIYVSFVKR